MSEAESFQQEPLGEVHRRGVEKAKTVCAVSDGADWIQKWVDYHRPDAVRILDFPHAMEYISQGGQAAYEHLPRPPEDQRLTGQQAAKRQQQRFEQWLSQQGHELKTGDVAQVLAELERLRSLMQQAGQREAVESLDKSLFYLRRRPQMTTYAHFRAQGYPIGSGSVESANKLVVQSRMKQAGMRLGPGHVNAMLAMRNLACNDRWREGWAAIRQTWHQNELARRAQRATCPSSSEFAPPTACPSLSLLPPVSRGLQCSPPRSSRPMHRLNLVRCGLLLPIRGDALFSVVVPLSREVWNLQKSHAHPIGDIVHS